jgi:hypothetical protein
MCRVYTRGRLASKRDDIVSNFKRRQRLRNLSGERLIPLSGATRLVVVWGYNGRDKACKV